MILTGKCKEAFEKWHPEYLGSINKWAGCEHPEDIIQEFYKIALPSMQWGVYVDFFDSVGLEIEVKQILFWTYWISLEIESSIKLEYKNFDTRLEARKASIEKANELYNNRV